jgi:hypothetical protein
MRPTTKAALLLFCLLLCAMGAVLSPRENNSQGPQSKTDVLPVNNHQPHRGFWLRV